MSIELSIMSKLNDDALQILEQILPFFQPVYHLPVNFLGNLKEKKDVAVQLDSISMEDDYEGNFDTRRALVYTLRFTARLMSLVLFLMLLIKLSEEFRLVTLLEKVPDHMIEILHIKLFLEQQKIMINPKFHNSVRI